MASVAASSTASSNTTPSDIRLSSVKALVFKQIRFWLGVSGGLDETDPETGKKTHWVFKSARQLTEELHKLYPGLSVSRETVSRALRSLVSMGLLQAEKKRKNRWDQTTWFSLTELGERITGKTSSPEPDQPTESLDHTRLGTADQHQRSTSSKTSKRRRPIGFGKSNSRTALTEINASATRPAQKPAGKILINGIWCCDDNLFPSYA